MSVIDRYYWYYIALDAPVFAMTVLVVVLPSCVGAVVHSLLNGDKSIICC